MARGQVTVKMVADASGVARGTRQAEREFAGFRRDMEGHMKSMRSSALGLASSFIGPLGVAYGLESSVKAATDLQTVQAKTSTQLKALGISYGAHAKQIQEVVDKVGNLSGFQNKDLLDSFANVVRSTGNVRKALDLMGTAADLARVKHEDVATAGQDLGKVMAGNTRAIKALGLGLPVVTSNLDRLHASTKNATAEQVRAAKAADKTASAQAALGVLQDKLKGQAEAYGHTSAGAADRFKRALEELQITIGNKLIPVLIPLANKATEFVKQMQDGKGAGGQFVAVLKSVYDAVKPIVKFFFDHPKMIAVAVAAWATYKGAVLANLAATKIAAVTTATTMETAAAGAAAGWTAMLGPLGAVLAATVAIQESLHPGGDINSFIASAQQRIAAAQAGNNTFAAGAAAAAQSGGSGAAGNPFHGPVVRAPRAPSVHIPHVSIPSVPSTGSGGGGSSGSGGGGGTTRVSASTGGIDVSRYNHIYSASTLANPGTQLSVRAIRAIYENAGFSPGRALQMSQIAHGESGYHPGIISFDHGLGLSQITPWAMGAGNRAYMNSLGGEAAMRNPILNAMMAKHMFDAGGFAPWKGTAYLNRNMDVSSVKSVLSGSHVTAARHRPIYVNPLQHASSVRRSRTDQGVDFGFGGPLSAIGDGTITAIKHFQGFGVTLVQRLANGPRKGQYIYYALETGATATCHAGQVVHAGQQIAKGLGSGGVEIGFAGPDGLPITRYSPGQSHNVPTKGGLEFSGFLADIAKGKYAVGPTVSSSGGSSLAAPLSLSDIRGNDMTAAQAVLNTIGLRQGAGMISQASADHQSIKVINAALGGRFGPLTGDDKLTLLGARRTANQDLRAKAKTKKQKAAAAKKWAKSAPDRAVQKVLDSIQNSEDTGYFTSQQADNARGRVIGYALAGKYGAITSAYRNELVKLQHQVSGNLATDATDAAAQSLTDAQNFVGTAFDDAALTQAQVDTPTDTSDDLAIEQGRLGLATTAYNAAKASGDKAGIQSWGQIMISLKSSIDSLDQTVADNTSALLDLQKQSTQQYQALYNTSQAQYAALARGFADMVSGELGGRTGLGFMSPATAGSFASY